MARLPNVRLDLTNRPENVLLVRETLTGVALAIGLDGSDLSDIRTAVTEACNNVVLHAYGEQEGTLEVEISLGESLEVVVRDRGVGMAGEREEAANDPGIGLPVIEALARTVEFEETPGSGGTEVRMTFAAPAGRGLEPGGVDGGELTLPSGLDGAATATISIAPTALARSVIPRLLSVLAARAQFSTDRISDSQLLADALVAHAGSVVRGSHLSISVNVELRDLQLRIGPLIAGHAERLVVDSDVAGLGRVLEKLADRHRVTSSDSHDTLTLQLLDRR
jgi:serine/threonine-protein kinase RsbW